MSKIKKLYGLSDWQVNGYKGIDFNKSDLTSAEVSQASRFLLEEGVTSFFPTLITNYSDQISKLIQVIVSADDSRGARIAGIHLEGPFISPQDGARGAHPLECVTAPNWEWVEKWQKEANHKIKLITMSPEWPNSAEFIRKCVSDGIKVAIGHTMATSEQISEAVEAGATLSTHLGNGCPSKIQRHPNPIWEQLAQDKLWISAIGDGFHLPEQVLKVFAKVKKEKMFWISDSTALAGEKPGNYFNHIGGNVVLTSEGRLHLADSPELLAGAAMSLRQMIEKVWQKGWFSLEDAWRMGSEGPWDFLEESFPEGDFIEVEIDEEIHSITIVAVWKNNEKVWDRRD